MDRVAYCREQATLCRDMARSMSSQADADVVIQIAQRFEAEAMTLEKQKSLTPPRAV